MFLFFGETKVAYSYDGYISFDREELEALREEDLPYEDIPILKVEGTYYFDGEHHHFYNPTVIE